MTDTDLYIERQDPENVLYTQFQQKALNELQRLSGKVWTDFNAHDPGVTITDLAGYVLSELDYKFGFPLQDYLTTPADEFRPADFGLFLPEAVYPTAPVTRNDYLRALVAAFPMLERIGVTCDAATGRYTIRILPSPFETDARGCAARVGDWYHAHRNLCENLAEVVLLSPEKLHFHSEFEILPLQDPAVVLARIYWTILRYLGGSTRIEDSGPCASEGLSPEEWFDGPAGRVRVVVPPQQDTVQELFSLLSGVEGVRSFKTCYLVGTEEGREVIRTDFKTEYDLFVPRRVDDLRVRITVDGLPVGVDVGRFVAELQALYYSGGASRLSAGTPDAVRRACDEVPEGTFRDVFSHRPMASDLPRCYDMQSPGAKPLGEYLRLFDLLARRSLTELRGVVPLLSLDGEPAVACDLTDGQSHPARKFNDRYRDVTGLKTAYLDYLDHQYGLESDPDWLRTEDRAQSPREHLRRRMEFLSDSSRLVRDRAKACNLHGGIGGANIPAIKAFLCRLLGMNADESIPAGNVLPGHNLILLEDIPRDRDLRGKLNSELVDGRLFDAMCIEPLAGDVPPVSPEQKQAQYREMRRELAAFNGNLICGGLFRHGGDLDNYRLAQMPGGEWMLVFRNEEESSWMNLGLGERETLERCANILTRYLQELNRLCETVYVVEHALLIPSEPFFVTFVFPGWTARFHTPRVREECRRLVRSRLAAHIGFVILWLDDARMRRFEACYRAWRTELAEGDSEKDLQKAGAELKSMLGDNLV